MRAFDDEVKTSTLARWLGRANIFKRRVNDNQILGPGKSPTFRLGNTLIRLLICLIAHTDKMPGAV